MRYIGLHILLFILISKILYTQEVCKIQNHAFQSGEELKYTVAYHWGFIKTNVAAVSFTVKSDTIKNKPYLHIDAIGRTFSSWDWFFKVRDRYQTWIDPEDIRPVKFKRHVDEGGWKLDLQYNFNRDQNLAYSFSKQNEKPLTKDTISVPFCTYDVLSVIYVARNIDYSSYKIGDTIPITLLLDNKLEEVYFRYLGREEVKVRKSGTYNCYKFSVLLVQGSAFKGGEDLLVWVTDDMNRIPVKIETPIIVGKVKVRLVEASGLKNPQNAKIK